MLREEIISLHLKGIGSKRHDWEHYKEVMAQLQTSLVVGEIPRALLNLNQDN